jgi:predicted nucleotidyltransferase
MKIMNINQIKEKILPVIKKNEVSRASLFGSIVRGEATEDSDIDLLVEFRGEKVFLILQDLR